MVVGIVSGFVEEFVDVLRGVRSPEEAVQSGVGLDNSARPSLRVSKRVRGRDWRKVDE